MAQPYVGEIRMFAGNFAPAGWMFCEGQLLPISEYETLFVLIGTTYGGDGMETFALPDFRGRRGVHQGSNYVIGQTGGTETEVLTSSHIPKHTHGIAISTTKANLHKPTSSTMLATTVDANGDEMLSYINSAPNTLLAANTIVSSNGGQPHNNMDPYLCVNFIISLYGIFPSQT